MIPFFAVLVSGKKDFPLPKYFSANPPHNSQPWAWAIRMGKTKEKGIPGTGKYFFLTKD